VTDDHFRATRWLQVLLSFAILWAVIPLPLGLGDWIVARFTPEGHRLHGAMELVAGPLVVAICAVLLTALVRRFARGLLRLPDSVPPRRIFFRVALCLPLALLATFILFVGVSLILEPPPWKSDDVQHVPIVFFLATIGPILLTPVVAVVAAWWWLRRRAD
jgi:hypothetical protein